MRLGEYSFSARNDTRSRDFRVSEIRQHIDFDATTYDNDIAVVKLQQPALFNSYIWPVCMPPIDETYEGYMAIVTGWGTQYFGGPSSDVLMEVSLPIWTQSKCKSAFIERISDEVLCAGAPEGGRDSCQVKSPANMWKIRKLIETIFRRATVAVHCSCNCPIDAGSPLASFRGAFDAANQIILAFILVSPPTPIGLSRMQDSKSNLIPHAIVCEQTNNVCWRDNRSNKIKIEMNQTNCKIDLNFFSTTFSLHVFPISKFLTVMKAKWWEWK